LGQAANKDNKMQWIVTYAKILDDKQKGISIGGIYFGGLCQSEDEAAQIAKDCTHTIKNGMIIPKIAPLTDAANFTDALYDLYDQYCNMCDKMILANDVYNKPRRKN
jgi:hypothetical protein